MVFIAVDINEADPNMQRSGPNHLEHPVEFTAKTEVHASRGSST